MRPLFSIEAVQHTYENIRSPTHTSNSLVKTIVFRNKPKNQRIFFRWRPRDARIPLQKAAEEQSPVDQVTQAHFNETQRPGPFKTNGKLIRIEKESNDEMSVINSSIWGAI